MARVRSSLVAGLAAVMGSEEFVIVELTAKGPVPVYGGDGQLMKFTTGDAASKEALRMTAVGGKKFQPRRVKDDTWRTREEARFASKEYKNLPWSETVWWRAHKKIWGDHFPHVSVKNSVGLMAFTEDDDKGSADVQTPIKPGKYLERYFSDILDPYIIRDLCTKFSNVFEENCLLYANSEDEFEALYTSGPSSCMSHSKDKYTSHIHPVRVYAAGDLALVYMKRDGRVVARALCWPDKKKYSRVYGDAGRIEPLLAKEGYTKGPPNGARLQRVITWENKSNKSGNQAFVAPHIDDISSVTDMKDHLLIGSHDGGKVVKLTGASGVTEWVSVRCKCGKETTQSEMKQVYVDDRGRLEVWCNDCVRDKSFKCLVQGAIVSNECAVIMFDGSKMWRRSFTEGHGFVCAKSGKNYPVSQKMTMLDDNGKMIYVAKVWFKNQTGCRKCDTCGNNIVGACVKTCKDRHEHSKYAGLAKDGGLSKYAESTTWTLSRTR